MTTGALMNQENILSNKIKQSLISVSNKAVYTTASLAYGWAGAVMLFKQLYGKNFNSMTDRRTDGWMDRQMTYRQSHVYAGLDPLIGKIGKCLGPRALGGPAWPCRNTFKD